ncbi:hypothetical protein [Chamaesiphon sp.]
MLQSVDSLRYHGKSDVMVGAVSIAFGLAKLSDRSRLSGRSVVMI